MDWRDKPLFFPVTCSYATYLLTYVNNLTTEERKDGGKTERSRPYRHTRPYVVDNGSLVAYVFGV